jgi:hypothetical protein
MAKASPSITETGAEVPSQQRRPKSLEFAQHGITTSKDFANTMSALMCDLIEGAITPEVGNAISNVGGKLLKVVEMQYRYGSPPKSASADHTLTLAPGNEGSSS